MYLLNDSDATYCSKVEELLKAPTALRRSQRLSQKPKRRNDCFPWNNVRILKNGLCFKAKERKNSGNFAKNRASKSKKCTHDIFNTQVLGEEQVANNNVPLDLPNKSKVVKKQTFNGELDIFNVTPEVNSDKNKNVAEKANETAEDNSIKQKRKRGRPKKVHDANIKILPLDTTKSAKLNKAVVEPSKSNKILLDPLPPSEHINVHLNTNLNKNSKTIKAIDKDLHSKSFRRSCGTLVSNKGGVEAFSTIKPQIKELPLKSLKRSGSTLVSNKSIQLLSENSNTACKKRIKLLTQNRVTKNNSPTSNENKATKILGKIANKSSKDMPSKAKTTISKLSNSPVILNKLSNYSLKQTDLTDQNLNTTNVMKCNKSSKRTSHVFGNKNSEDLRSKKETIKTKLNISQDIFEKFSNDTQMLKRSQKTLLSGKRKTNLVKNASNTESQTNEMQTSIQQIKSEQLTPLDTFAKTFEDNSSLTKGKRQTSLTKNHVTRETSKEQNNSSEIKSETFSSRPIDSGEKSYKKRSQITNKDNNILQELQNVTNNFQTYVTAQKSSNKINKINISQNTCITRSSNKLPNEKTQQLETNTQSVAENLTLNKNYLKSFDKTNIATNHNVYEKTLPANILPTPDDSTQEFIAKKSLLPLNYPSHFKYQLPPETVLTHSSNEQFQPLNVITPDDTPAFELLESSSSSPSLPESLCKLFENKNIKDILNVDKVSYRLYDYHVQALALMLNLNLEYLHKILNKIMNIKPNVLKNIDKVLKIPFVADHDLFAATSEESWDSGEVVFNSQNSKKRRFSVIGERIGY
ncbi:uncharacterized protein LOC124420154 [Lucilia cuprina]|uniref:uncharacterized protein LOC124420154 n=1 Tax=Lucilia cuprina TaxID=7375 RepID=UPI001F06E254|nr:uncharacterized protein LOC124420154 [Lucilia cuprina]